jgi:hypothetical protein
VAQVKKVLILMIFFNKKDEKANHDEAENGNPSNQGTLTEG